ncbi:hypothetical protein D3C87_1672310 [compost metagenome]
MQQHRVVTGFSDRQMEFRIRCALFRTAHLIVARVAVLQFVERRSQPFAIDIRGTQRCVIGAGRFQGVTKLQQVALGFRVAFQQMQQRITERRSQRLHHIVAAALATDQQTLGRQFLNRFTQRRA